VQDVLHLKTIRYSDVCTNYGICVCNVLYVKIHQLVLHRRIAGVLGGMGAAAPQKVGNFLAVGNFRLSVGNFHNISAQKRTLYYCKNISSEI